MSAMSPKAFYEDLKNSTPRGFLIEALVKTRFDFSSYVAVNHDDNIEDYTISEFYGCPSYSTLVVMQKEYDSRTKTSKMTNIKMYDFRDNNIMSITVEKNELASFEQKKASADELEHARLSRIYAQNMNAQGALFCHQEAMDVGLLKLGYSKD